MGHCIVWVAQVQPPGQYTARQGATSAFLGPSCIEMSGAGRAHRHLIRGGRRFLNCISAASRGPGGLKETGHMKKPTSAEP